MTKYRIRIEDNKGRNIYFLEKVEYKFPYFIRYITLLGAYDNIEEAEKDGLEMKKEEAPPTVGYKYL
jgi:hypothetical protein